MKQLDIYQDSINFPHIFILVTKHECGELQDNIELIGEQILNKNIKWMEKIPLRSEIGQGGTMTLE